MIGFVAVVAGLWEGSYVLRDIVNEAQGKCDYASCVGPWTMPILVVAILLVSAGASTLAWSLLVRRTRARRR